MARKTFGINNYTKGKLLQLALVLGLGVLAIATAYLIYYKGVFGIFPNAPGSNPAAKNIEGPDPQCVVSFTLDSATPKPSPKPKK